MRRWSPDWSSWSHLFHFVFKLFVYFTLKILVKVAVEEQPLVIYCYFTKFKTNFEKLLF